MRSFRQAVLPSLCAALLVALAPSPAFGWHDTGHMLVSQVAYLNLTPEAKARVDKLLIAPPGRRPYIHLCAGYYTAETCEKIYDPVTIGVWMDDFRGDSLNEHYAPWHYINYNPFFDGIPARPNVGPEPENVLARLNWAINSLRAGTGRERTDAELLGFLHHLVGDVHQPLHATTRYTAARPDGDAGGNGFRIQSPQGANLQNLHAFWDAAAGEFGTESPRRPLDEAARARIRQQAEGLLKEHPAATLAGARELDPHAWVAESNGLARQFVYAGIKEGEAPSPEYTDRARKLSRQRIALAGYRLAAVLNSLLVRPEAQK
jgi:hypothetical protein